MPEIVYRTDLDHVDWTEMKSTLCQDAFDNGRSSQQLKKSFENSYATCIAYANNQIIGTRLTTDNWRLTTDTCIAYANNQIIGTARILSDGVCNAYLVDVWTLSAYRRQGIATTMIQKLLYRLKGQHVYLFTDDIPELYTKLGFVEQPIGMGQVIGTWLVNEA